MVYQPFVVSIVLNFNQFEDLYKCLESLYVNTYQNHKIILLNYDLSPRLSQVVRYQYPEILIIDLQENYGYAGNNNIGIEAAMKLGAEWVFILNSDTIINPDTITQLILGTKNDKKVGIVGPMVYYFDDPNVIQTAGGKINKYFHVWHLGKDEKDIGQYQKPIVVDWISGCGIMICREVIDQVGIFDARFFMYYEELDWCLRSHFAGWKNIVVPSAKMWHKGVKGNYQPKPYVSYYMTRNHLLILSKYRVPIYVWVKSLFQIVRTLTSWTIKPKWKHLSANRDAMWQGLWDFVFYRWGEMST